MTVIVTIPDSAITLGSSQFSEQLYALKDNAEFRGARKEPQGENVVYYISPEKMPISAMRTVVENGGEVEDFPVFIEIDSVETLVPEGFFMGQFEDEEGVTHQKTWGQWLAQNCSPLELAGKIYVESSGCGVCLKGSELVSVFDQLTHKNRIQDIQEEENAGI